MSETLGCGHPDKNRACGDCLDEAEAEVSKLELQVGALKKQLRTAQDVIQKHVADQVEGLHCVDCVAEDSVVACDCPMLVQIFEAMKGYEPPTIEDLLGECRECNRLLRDCGNHRSIPPNTENRNHDTAVAASQAGLLLEPGAPVVAHCRKCKHSTFVMVDECDTCKKTRLRG